jgi:hypothetical protein
MDTRRHSLAGERCPGALSAPDVIAYWKRSTQERIGKSARADGVRSYESGKPG